MKDILPQQIVDKVVKQLAEARMEQGLSYEKLAEKTGLHRTAISLIERGERSPTLLNCLKIAQGLGVDLGEAIKGTKIT